MAVHKLTIFFESGLYGWTESFWKDTNQSLAATVLQGRDLALKRAVLCGFGVKITYLRASDEATRGDSSILSTQIWVVGGDFKPPATQDQRAFYTVTPAEASRADQPYSAVLLRLESGPSAGPPPIGPRRRNMYLRGLPDIDIINPPPFIQSDAWRNAFNAWVAEVSKWSFRATLRTLGAARNILGWTLTPTFITLNITNHPFVAGDTIVVEGATLQESGSFKPNRLMKVAFVPDANNIQCVALNGRPIRYIAGTVVNGGKATAVTNSIVYPLINFATITGETHRNTGRPFGSPRGRRSAKL